MDNQKRSSIDEFNTAASALRRLTRTPTSQRLGLRRSSTSFTFSSATSSISSLSSFSDEQTPPSCASRNTSSDDCALYKFIVWVAVKRNACQKMTPEERRECPLLNCRQRFPNHELMLSHLYTCRHLSGGEYWCHDCERPEKLNDAKCRRCLGHPSKRKKLISMAKKVFGSLGSRPKNNAFAVDAASLSVDDEPPSYDAVCTSVCVELPPNEIHEIDSVEMTLPAIPESEPEPDSEAAFGLKLQYPLDDGVQPQATADLHPSSLAPDFMNWDPAPSPQTVAPQNLIRPVPGRLSDRPALQLHTHGLDHYRPQARRRSKNLAPSSSVRSTSSTESAGSMSSTESYEVSPMSGWSGGWAKVPGFESTITSPCDDFACPEDAVPAESFVSSYKPIGFSDLELESLVGNSFLTELPAEVPAVGMSSDPLEDGLSQESPTFCFDVTAPVPKSADTPVVTTDQTDMSQHYPLAIDMTGGSLTTADSLIGSAQDTLRVHMAESRAKLTCIGNNPLVNEFRTMPDASIVLVGVETMVDLLHGRPVASPIKLLCFNHLAFSIALMVHEKGIESRCTSLFRQVLLYSHRLLPRDRLWYGEAVRSLWKPGAVSNDDVTHMLRASDHSATGPTYGKGKEPAGSLEASRDDPLLAVLQYFVDELEYLALHELKRPEIQACDLSIRHIKDAFGAATDSPLRIEALCMIENHLSRMYSHVPGFQAGVQSIMDQLNTGQISTARRLELELMQTGKIYLPWAIFFDEYIGHVRTRLDSLYPVSGSTPNSRLIYHSYGAKLMEQLIRGCSSDGVSCEGGLAPVEAAPTSMDGLIGAVAENEDFDLDAMIDFGPEFDTGSPSSSSSTGTILPQAGAGGGWRATPTSDVSGSMMGRDGDSPDGRIPAPAPVPAPPQPPSSVKPNLAATVKPSSPTCNRAEPPVLTKMESDTCCEICGYRPRGDPQWFRGSMAKHKKLQHSEETKIYRCPYPGCTSQYSRRRDNLRQHQIDKGHFVDGQGVTGKRNRKREWSAEVE